MRAKAKELGVDLLVVDTGTKSCDGACGSPKSLTDILLQAISTMAQGFLMLLLSMANIPTLYSRKWIMTS